MGNNGKSRRAPLPGHQAWCALALLAVTAVSGCHHENVPAPGSPSQPAMVTEVPGGRAPGAGPGGVLPGAGADAGGTAVPGGAVVPGGAAVPGGAVAVPGGR